MKGDRPFLPEREVGAGERRKMWEQFRNDQELLTLYNVKADEMEALKQAALLGTLLNKNDFIFMLGIIRRKRGSGISPRAIQPSVFPVTRATRAARARARAGD